MDKSLSPFAKINECIKFDRNCDLYSARKVYMDSQTNGHCFIDSESDSERKNSSENCTSHIVFYGWSHIYKYFSVWKNNEI